VCQFHGAGAPQVREAAKRRLLAAADFAIDYLLKLLEPRPPCPNCGRSDADRDPVVVRACQLVLDRSGFHPSLTLEQAPPAPDKFAHYTDDQIVEKLEQMLAAAIERRDLHRRAQLPKVVDEGFVVPDDDEPDPDGAKPLGELPTGKEDER
jgi:hypothetical protein